VAATISLCLDLLPYYTPDLKVVNFEFERNSLKEYLELIQNDFVFVVLAAFIDILEFPLKAEFESPLRDMVAKFRNAGDVLTLGDDPVFAAIKQSISKWRPSNMDKTTSAYLTKRMLNVMLVEYAAEVDDKFKV
jgi:hypothetical protein